MTSGGRQPSSPRVTVLLPVHQGAAFLREAVDSILGQTFRDFELLVVDDGSTDGSGEIVAGYADPRIRLLRHERNLGIVASLNRGLELARGEIVARMDADDVSLPQRLQRQLAFLDANPEVGMCGSWVAMGPDGTRYEYPTRAEDIRCRLLFDPAFAHPTVCLRRTWFAHHGLRFDDRYLHAEDYDLWRRASERFPLANLGEVLLRYRVHDGSVTQRHRPAQIASGAKIQRELLAGLGISPSDEELAVHRGGMLGEPDPPLPETERWLLGLLRANEERKRYPQAALGRAVGHRWLRAARRAVAQRRPAWSCFARSPLTHQVDPFQRLRLALRAASIALRGVPPPPRTLAR